MKILISINAAWNILNFRTGLVRALLAVGHEVVAAAPADEHVPALEALGCRFVPLPMDNKGTNPASDALLFWRYLRLLRAEQPDVFLGYTIKPNVYGSLAARLLGIPFINNISGLGTAFIRDGLLTRIVKPLYRQALWHSNRVFFQNEDDRELFINEGLVRLEQVGLLPGSGIDLQRFRPRPPRETARDETRFLLIARMLWDKGVGEFVEAARAINKLHPAVRFQLLGFLDAENRTAVPRRKVEQWVTEGLVNYLGVTDDVRPFIADADCVVLPSYREGTPRTLLEAAAMGKPLIATNVPGCREVVGDGVNGFLCEARDADDLAEKMSRFIALSDAEKAVMGECGHQKMEREYDERIVIDRYMQEIDRLTSSMRTGSTIHDKHATPF